MSVLERSLDVLRICLPIFGMMGLGRVLRRRGYMSADHQDFLNRIAYHFALPSLVFVELVVQPFAQLFDPVLIIGTAVAMLGIMAVYAAAAKISGMRGGVSAAFTFSSFWANVSYMGFPLAASAFGAQRGIALAAIVNAFAVPLTVLGGFGVIVLNGAGSGGRRKTVHTALASPVVLAAFLGIIGAGVGGLIRTQVPEIPVWTVQFLESIRALLKMVGSMGLPLALMAVGGAVDFKAIRGRLTAVVSTVAGKLILAPLMTFLLIRGLFPAADREALGVAVLLMATPSAVASYVVSRQLSVAEDFVASALVLSTALSLITIPIWLFVLL